MRILLSILIFTSAPAFAAVEPPASPAEWCASQLASSSFNAKQRAAVTAAATDGYSIRRFTGVIDGTERAVTVVGESLIKSRVTAANGARLATTFDVVARTGGRYFEKGWLPKIFSAYVARRLTAERAGTEAEHFGSIADLLNEGDVVRRFEDEVVAKLVARHKADPRFNAKLVRHAVDQIRLNKALIGFDHQDVVRRVLANEVERPARPSIELDQDYRPTLRHNMAMLFVVTADKLGVLAGRVQRIATALALAGGVGWMAMSNGHDGGWLTLGAAGVLAVQTAIDVGRRDLTPEFAGISPLSYHLTDALVRLLGETDPKDEVLLVVSEIQARKIALRLVQRGFNSEVNLPFVEDGNVVGFTR